MCSSDLAMRHRSEHGSTVSLDKLEARADGLGSCTTVQISFIEHRAGATQGASHLELLFALVFLFVVRLGLPFLAAFAAIRATAS